MKILYLSGSYVPSRRASSVHVMRMCQAMAEHGHGVMLVTKDNSEVIEPGVEDDFGYYGVKANFSIKKLARPSQRGGGVRFTWKMYQMLSALNVAETLVYSRELFGAWIAARKGFRVVLEAHTLPMSWFSRQLYRQLFGFRSFCRFVVISQALRESFAAASVFPEADRVLVAHDAADPIRPNAGNGHQKFQDGGKLQLGYVGQLYSGKGMEIVIPLAKRMPDIDFHIVGGRIEDLRYWQGQNLPSNLNFHGFVSPGDVSALYEQFDVLLLPAQNEVYGASGQSDLSRWMSPLKMFEYMAAGKPIVSSDLPVLREVLVDGENALLVRPDDVGAWETAVRRLMDEPGLGERIGRRAHQDFMENYTWGARAKKVLHGL